MNGMNGASSFAISTRQWRRVPNAAGVALPEAPAADPHVPVRELVDVGGDRAAGGRRVEVVERGADLGDRRLQPRDRPAVELLGRAAGRRVAVSAGRGGRSGRIDALGVRVEDVEGIGVPERQQELADRLADRLGREAVAGPGLLGGQVVPAEGVGAVRRRSPRTGRRRCRGSSTSSGPRGRGSARGRRSSR